MSDLTRLELDLELPTECWDLEDLGEEQAALFRLVYIKGYTDATKDAKRGKMGQLLLRLARLQRTPVAPFDGPS